jgi:twitching motility protein PilT
MRTIEQLLAITVDREASDLHLVEGYAPFLRVHGDLAAVDASSPALSDVGALIAPILPADARVRLNEQRDLDFATQIDHQGHPERFRVNVFFSRGDMGACFRHIAAKVPSLNEIGFPLDLADAVSNLTSGLVLVTGITGAGKTTSLAALIQKFNVAGGNRIITIEQPVEYLFDRSHGSIITQREVGADVASFYDGLRYGLRQDPDIILVGEIRDRETAQLALSAAETGHIILSTLHTADAKGAITRLVDLFPTEQHSDVRTQLSMSLRFVIAQHLLPAPGGAGRRVLAMEVMAASFPVRSAIRAGKIEQLESAIQSGRREGMWSLDAHLHQLVQEGRIDMATARQFAKDPGEFGVGGTMV